MNSHHDVLVVGTGPAGIHTVLGLLAAEYSGSIGLVGSEPDLPYERPPLSKAYLLGDLAGDKLLVRQEEWWTDTAVDMLLGTTVDSVDSVNGLVRTRDGRELSYGTLVWAAGCRPRPLAIPGGSADGVLSLRTRSDADSLRDRFRAGAQRLVVIGGGYIGLEVAAAASKLGAAVTVIEQQERLLSRVTGSTVADFIASEYEAADIRLILGDEVEEVVGGGAARGVTLRSGRTVDADVVLVGIGVVPNVEALVEAGARCGNGVLVDRMCRTSLDAVYGVGDCALVEDVAGPAAGLRLESIQNAGAHARAVVSAITGSAPPDPETPWFWSNLFDLRLRTAGLIALGYDRAVVRGRPSSRKFSVVYLSGRTVIAIDTVNSPKDFAQGKALIGREWAATEAELGDPAVSLKLGLVEPQDPVEAMTRRSEHEGKGAISGSESGLRCQ